MLPRQDHFEYSALPRRPQFSWPNGKRLAFHLCLNLEVFSFNTGLGVSYSPGLPHPNSYNWGWREYGNRVGVWLQSALHLGSLDSGRLSHNSYPRPCHSYG